MRAGPKPAADPSLPELPVDLVGSARFAAFAERYLIVPKGKGAGGPLVLRPWQRQLVGSILDASPRPRTAGWMLPRGNGKTSLVAALGLFELVFGGEGASVVVAAVDERQAGLAYSAARRMVEMSPEMTSRISIYADRLTVPDRGAEFRVLPGVAKALEGLDPSFAIIDEAGVVDRAVYETIVLASGKREESTVLAIGTPGPERDGQVLLDLRDYAIEHPDDTTLAWREFSAAGFEDHPPDCSHCAEAANPALDDFLFRDALTAVLPPKMREASFRRARLCQLSFGGRDALLPPGVWDGLSTGAPVPDDAEVILSLDGSFNSDATGLVVATVAAEPHVDVAGLWEPPEGDDDWRVPVLEVEHTIREACRRWNVREVVADPFRWRRSLEVLGDDGVPVIEFPQSPTRLTPATADLVRACLDGKLSHSGDARLARHVDAATVLEDHRGARLAKGKRGGRRIDLAACLLMAHSRATWCARPKKSRRARSFK